MDSVHQVSSLLDTTKSLNVQAARSVPIRRLGDEPGQSSVPIDAIRKLLDSRFDREILEGLRKTISHVYQGQECLPLFSSVVKLVGHSSLEAKKLVYIFLLHYAEEDPDLTLLSINTIQKSLSDQNPQVRALALRAMSGIRVPVISQIVLLAIKKGCADMAAVVRKAAALAIPKCFRLDPSTLPQLHGYLEQLIGDKQYVVVGAAITAFMDVCPDEIDLIHPHFKSIVRRLTDMDEWSQCSTLKLFLRYCRLCFPPAKAQLDHSVHEEDPVGVHPDLEFLLATCKNLLQSRSSAVILSVVALFASVGTFEHIKSTIEPLIGLLRRPQSMQKVILTNVVETALRFPSLFVPYINRFWVAFGDRPEVVQLKLEALTIIFSACDEDRKNLIFVELKHMTASSNSNHVRESIRALGRCAQNDDVLAPQCLDLLLSFAMDGKGALISEALKVIRVLIQSDPEAHQMTVVRLAANLNKIVETEARATIIWLVGESARAPANLNIAPDVMRLLTSNFAKEQEDVKMQIVTLAAKVYLRYRLDIAPPTPEKPEKALDDQASENNKDKQPESENSEDPPQTDNAVEQIYDHIMLLASYDESFSLRDRVRTYKTLLSRDTPMLEIAQLVIQAPKPQPQLPNPSETRRGLPLGSTSLALGIDFENVGFDQVKQLPEWTSELRGVRPDEIEHTKSSIPASVMLESGRQTPQTPPIVESAAPKTSSAKMKSLDDWLAEENKPILFMGTNVAKSALPVRQINLRHDLPQAVENNPNFDYDEEDNEGEDHEEEEASQQSGDEDEDEEDEEDYEGIESEQDDSDLDEKVEDVKGKKPLLPS